MEIIGRFVFKGCNTADRQFSLDVVFDEDFKVDNDVIPFAEYYLGGHEQFRSTILKTGESLIDHVNRLEPDQIGKACFKKYSTTLPFMTKVMSVSKPMPFKCHPSIKLSKKFNKKLPRDFPITGGRKVLIIPISKCQVLAGFKPLECIIEALKNVEEFDSLVGKELIHQLYEENNMDSFLLVFERLLFSNVIQVKKAASILINRLREMNPCLVSSIHNLELMEIIHKFMPGDVGVFLPYFCHLLSLEPYEGLLISDGIPFSIVEGNVLECTNMMDNSICGALGQKIYVREFITCVSFESTTERKFRKANVIWSIPTDEHLKIYKTLIPNFLVIKGCVPLIDHYILPKCKSISLLIGISGEARTRYGLIITTGTALILYADQELEVSIFNESFVFYQISVNSSII